MDSRWSNAFYTREKSRIMEELEWLEISQIKDEDRDCMVNVSKVSEEGKQKKTEPRFYNNQYSMYLFKKDRETTAEEYRSIHEKMIIEEKPLCSVVHNKEGLSVGFQHLEEALAYVEIWKERMVKKH